MESFNNICDGNSNPEDTENPQSKTLKQSTVYSSHRTQSAWKVLWLICTKDAKFSL